MFDMLLEACPNIKKDWKEHLEYWARRNRVTILILLSLLIMLLMNIRMLIFFLTSLKVILINFYKHSRADSIPLLGSESVRATYADPAWAALSAPLGL